MSKQKQKEGSLIPHEAIEGKILLIRGKKVMLDRDLASLYGVETRVLNQAVRRNIDRFPDDFMFSLTRQEIRNLSQIVISSKIKHSHCKDANTYKIKHKTTKGTPRTKGAEDKENTKR